MVAVRVVRDATGLHDHTCREAEEDDRHFGRPQFEDAPRNVTNRVIGRPTSSVTISCSKVPLDGA